MIAATLRAPGVADPRQGANAGGDVLQGGGVTLHEFLVTVSESLF